MIRAALADAAWTLLAAGLLAGGCGGDVREAVLSVREGENLPCLGVRRIKITVFKDEVSGKSVEVFGEFYKPDGSCNLPVGLPVDISGLPYTSKMSIQVEGFDSSEKRMMCVGRVEEQVTRKTVENGDLGEMALNRVSVDVGGVRTYPTGTLEIPSLPGVEQINPIDAIWFNVNAGTPDKVNGSFLLDPEVSLGETELALSNLLPRDPTNTLLIVAYYRNEAVGQWQNVSSFTIGDMITVVDVFKVP
jgi:hypothetical protein